MEGISSLYHLLQWPVYLPTPVDVPPWQELGLIQPCPSTQQITCFLVGSQ